MLLYDALSGNQAVNSTLPMRSQPFNSLLGSIWSIVAQDEWLACKRTGCRVRVCR